MKALLSPLLTLHRKSKSKTNLVSSFFVAFLNYLSVNFSPYRFHCFLPIPCYFISVSGIFSYDITLLSFTIFLTSSNLLKPHNLIIKKPFSSQNFSAQVREISQDIHSQLGDIDEVCFLLKSAPKFVQLVFFFAFHMV